MPILRLAIPSPLRRTFDYLPPEGMTGEEAAGLRPGIRLRVPFGSREVTGYLLGLRSDSDQEEGKLKRALEILDYQPMISPGLLQLCQWASDYYHHPPGEVYPCAFPNRLRKGAALLGTGEPGWRLTPRGMGLPPGALARSPRQAQALALLQSEGAVTTARFGEQGIRRAVLRTLQEKGLAEGCLLAHSPGEVVVRPGLALNPEQTAVLRSVLQARNGFSCHLLEGVTGSGKTEIYLQLIADCLERGKQALVLIPEIGLTPQTLQRFEERFGTGIAVFHSGLGENDRCRAWESARDGTARIVIGTRSAVFTPLAQPGLLVVDEEHDASYKQQDGFRYSARDVAVKRAQLEQCPVLLGSATPSLESLHNALSGRYRLHQLTGRAGEAQLPSLEALDVRCKPLQAGLSEPLLDGVATALASDQQVLLFLNRRGYAPTLRCHDCGWIAECRHCDARFTIHRGQRRLRCHHCGAAERLPQACPHCHSNNLIAAGLGTEQTEGFLRHRFGDWPVFRVDSDSMKGRHAMQSLVAEINRGRPCILLGTQMLTKGHHFPGVGLVAVIDTDAMLFSADFRGEERMAQLLTQVAGRAGRGGERGRVILQTHYPDHPAIQAMLSESYHAQARDILARRTAAGMPPAGQLILLRSDCVDAGIGEQFLQLLRRRVEPCLPPQCRLIGPLPSPMQRRAGKFRSQMMLTAPNRPSAQAAASQLVALAEELPAGRGLKWSIDVDPQDIF